MEKEIEKEIEFFKRMMESCYCYGSLEHYFDKYLRPYKDILGPKLFEEIYASESARLNQYEIKYGTFTDGEGCTYNSLVKKSTI